MQAFMFPSVARALLARSQAFTAAKRQEKAEAARKVAEFNAALAQLQRLGWGEEAAKELATIKAYGVQQ